jgi:hypothetical protein
MPFDAGNSVRRMSLRLFAIALVALQLASCGASGESGGQAGAGAAGSALGGGLCRRTCTVIGGQTVSANGSPGPSYANHLECPTERCAIVTSSYGLCGWTL